MKNLSLGLVHPRISDFRALRLGGVENAGEHAPRQSLQLLRNRYSLISGEDAMPTGLLMLVIVEKGNVRPFLYPTTLSN